MLMNLAFGPLVILATVVFISLAAAGLKFPTYESVLEKGLRLLGRMNRKYKKPRIPSG